MQEYAVEPTTNDVLRSDRRIGSPIDGDGGASLASAYATAAGAGSSAGAAGAGGGVRVLKVSKAAKPPF